MDITTEFTWLLLAVVIAEIAVSLIAKRFFSNKSQIKFGEDLMQAVNKARQDVLAANELIAQMEAINLDLRKENQQLNAENLRLEKLLAQTKSQLNTALDDILFWQNECKKVFPNIPNKGGKIN